MDRSRVPENPGGGTVLLVLAWLWVGIPLAWGVADTISNAAKLFK